MNCSPVVTFTEQEGVTEMPISRSVLLRVFVVSAATLLIAGGAFALSVPLGNPSDGAADQGQPAAKRPVLTENSIRFGVYDPHGDFGDESMIALEHLYVPWEDVDLSLLPVADAYAHERHRDIMITVEPWSWSSTWHFNSVELLDGILAGKYDPNIATVCSAAAGLKSGVSIRWAQEMDAVDGQFPWAKWSAEGYIAAYRHFVTECRKRLPHATYVWSPKGRSSLAEFYPGDDYVDVIGLSVFGYQPYDRLNFGGDRTFAQSLEPGYRMVSGFGKPVMVAELGYEGDEDYVGRWAREVVTPHPQFPRLTTIVHYNDKEVFAWPQNFGLPNWRIGRPGGSGQRADQ